MPRNVTFWRLLAASLTASLLVGAAAARAQADAVNYVVQPGDTLIGLGETLLADPARWPTVQRINAVADPYRIPIGRQLRIPVSLLRKVPRQARVVTPAAAPAPTASRSALTRPSPRVPG